MKINITDDIYEVSGQVINVEDQHYTSTHISGGNSTTTYASNGTSYTSRTPVTSTVTHHQIQKVWLKDEKGKEHSFTFRNLDIDVREDNNVRIIFSKKNGQYFKIQKIAPLAITGA